MNGLAPRMLMRKAARALASAHLLLDAEDVDGACNRAYYAMFDAARAALSASSGPLSLDVIRTHSGLISTFSLHLVKDGPVSTELGRALNRAEEIQLIADYKGDVVELTNATEMMEKAEAFVAAIQTEFFARPHRGG